MAKRFIDVLRQELDSQYNAGGDTFRIAFLTEVTASFPTAVDAATDVFTAVGHNLINGCRVRFGNTGGDLPAPILANATYFVRDVSGNTFKITGSKTGTTLGAAINITTAGTGNHTVAEQQPDETDDLPILVRHEVDYFGSTVRPLYDPLPAIADYSNRNAYLPDITLIIYPNLGTLAFRHSLMIKNGAGARFDTTGIADNIHDHLTTQIVLQGSQKDLKISVRRINS